MKTNKFEVLLDCLNVIQEQFLGTEIKDLGGYGDRAYVELVLQDGSVMKIDVVCQEPPKSEQEGENEQ